MIVMPPPYWIIKYYLSATFVLFISQPWQSAYVLCMWSLHMQSLGWRGTPLMMADRIPLSLTYISYFKDDMWGKTLAYISMAPFIFAIFELGFVISPNSKPARRTVAILILLGQILNEVLNAVLKGFFKEPRPLGTERFDFGMPSSHSQFMGYLAAIAPMFVEYTVFRYFWCRFQSGLQ